MRIVQLRVVLGDLGVLLLDNLFLRFKVNRLSHSRSVNALLLQIFEISIYIYSLRTLNTLWVLLLWNAQRESPLFDRVCLYFLFLFMFARVRHFLKLTTRSDTLVVNWTILLVLLSVGMHLIKGDAWWAIFALNLEVVSWVLSVALLKMLCLLIFKFPKGGLIHQILVL